MIQENGAEMPQLSNSLHVRDIASLIHPQTNLRKHLETGPTIITRGEGIYVYDDAGTRYLEAAAGLWCASLGFGSERLAKVAYEQMRNIGYYHIYRSTSHGPAIELAEKLLEIAPVPMSKVLFQCSGSEANDTAIKLVWYYWHAVGKPKKKKIISRIQSYHGSTCAAVSLTGKPDMHADFGLPFEQFLHTEFPHYYRFAQPGETEEAFSTRMADALEKMILKEGPDTVAAFWAEPVMGAGGAVLPPAGYFAKIQAVLKKYDILFVADEVICGFGRTGQQWGSQTFGLEPDMLSCAKALSAGLAPISALLINERVFQSMLSESDKQGSFAHGYTYAGHPVTAAVALETLNIYEEIGILDHVRKMEATFLPLLRRLGEHPYVGHADGRGLIGGFEIVKDKATRQPFAAEAQIPAKIEARIRQKGVIVRLVGNRVAFSPPLIINESQIEEIFECVSSALDEVLHETRN
jgi:4-aminobutyrate--pyruvate transaminase